jgi:hypothetical protein
VTTTRKNFAFSRACLTSPAVMMKHNWVPRTPLTSSNRSR